MRAHTILIVTLLGGTGLVFPPAFAQTASFGLVGGTNLTDPFGTLSIPTQYLGAGAFVYSSGPRNFIIGPKLEVHFPWNLSVEADALHRNLQLSIRFVRYAPGVSQSPATLRTQTPWEFPLLAKYRFPILNLRPFVESGPSFRPAGNGTGLSHVGITAGAGLEMRIGALNISPEARYTHWDRISTFARPDQVEVLVGFDWSSFVFRPGDFGRRITLGAIAGVGAGSDFRPASSTLYVEHPESNSLIAGVSVEVSLPKRLSLEVDGMYRPLHATDVPVPSYVEGRSVRFATLTWEFPILAKYRFSASGARPFVEMGPSFRAIGNLEIAPPSHYGITAGAGVEFAIARLKISPAVRFTRWAPDPAPGDSAAAHAFLNQAQLLLAVSF
jgi:hypothetical protein